MNMKITLLFRLFFGCAIILAVHNLSAQDTLGNVSDEETEYITKAFWGTRVLNGHSIETTPTGQLDFRIQHRLGRLDGGFNELFGFDQASVRLGFEYGILDWIMVGLGRSTQDKFYNGFIKVKLLRQSKGKRDMPFSLIGMADMGIASGKWANPEIKNYFSSRLYYSYQLILGRKFGDRVGVQVSPTIIHRNLVNSARDHNDVFALGFGGRVRLGEMIALSAEYYYVFPHQVYSQVNGFDIVNNFSAGIEIYTGKHVFQVFVTNAIGSNEKQFITENTESWLHNGVHVGFNLTRLFRIARY